MYHKHTNMRVRVNNLDPTIIEDELGNPLFKYLSIYPQDLEDVVEKMNGVGVKDLYKEIDKASDRIIELEEEVEELEDRVDELESEVSDLEDKIDDLEN